MASSDIQAKLADIVLWIPVSDLAIQYAGEYARQASGNVDGIDRLADKIFFYRQIDLANLLAEMIAFWKIINPFSHFLSWGANDEVSEQEFRRLCSEPLIQRELSRIRGV